MWANTTLIVVGDLGFYGKYKDMVIVKGKGVHYIELN